MDYLVGCITDYYGALAGIDTLQFARAVKSGVKDFIETEYASLVEGIKARPDADVAKINLYFNRMRLDTVMFFNTSLNTSLNLPYTYFQYREATGHLW